MTTHERDLATARALALHIWLHCKAGSEYDQELAANAIAAALEVQRERDCKAVCWCCRHPSLWKPASYNEDAQMVGHTHIEEPIGFSKCDAAAIRQEVA